MFYAILKPVVRAALRLYFGRIVTNGLEHIDNGKPTLILANHTASFMDAIITACFVKRRIYFFTRGDVFRNKLVDKILRSLCMLPVYRMSDGRDKLQLNDSSNEEALRILARGGAVLIFAEGTSDIAKALKPLKKGPFRLAVTAAATLPAPPVLIPMGINYVRPTAPFGDAFLNAGPPIPMPDLLQATEAGSARAATDLMRATAAAIRPLAWHIETPGRRAEGNALLLILKLVKPGYSFADSQLLISQLNRTGTEAIRNLRAVRSTGPMRRIWRWTLLILLSPIALAGFLFHYPPIFIAERSVDSRVKEPDFRAPVFLSLALIFTVLWYASWIIAGLLTGKAGEVFGLLACAGMAGILYIKWYRPLWYEG
jgi:1-acyl-sn-glycerol-3-phosphate acyltransferase